jgi:hypothetical protein
MLAADIRQTATARARFDLFASLRADSGCNLSLFRFF